MLLKVLGSGSKGNCYILENQEEALILDAGIPFTEVKKALDFQVKKIVGVVVTHTHADHKGYIRQYERLCPSYKPFEDFQKIVKFGDFTIRPFGLVHDVPCYGFYIEHPDIGKMIYATDTEYIKYRFDGLSAMLLEANYSDDLISNYAINRSHVLEGHMSLKTALEFISVNDNPNLQNVILCHLSDKNSNEEKFLEEAKKTIKYGADCYIAAKGLVVNLNIVPFWEE